MENCILNWLVPIFYEKIILAFYEQPSYQGYLLQIILNEVLKIYEK